jgi:hypothetical protein
VAYIKSAAGAAENAWADKWSLHAGSYTSWAIGGTPALNNDRVVSVAAVDAAGETANSTLKAIIDADLQAKREVNFLIYVIDPQYTFIDVTFSAKALPGYLSADIEAATEAALAEYLSPAEWGAPQIGDPRDWLESKVVRVSELYQTINEVEGVDYVSVMTFGIQGQSLTSVDINIMGAVPLPRAGVIVGTIT